ncbi:MAG: DUF4265 domain-containing protein [Chloroflexota bacterium]
MGSIRRLVRRTLAYGRGLRGGQQRPIGSDAALHGEHLVKIRVDLPRDNEDARSESFWAEPLGNDLFRLRNTPFYAYDLHFLDVVRATPDAPGDLPTIREVVERSGHRTFRVLFAPSTSEQRIREILNDLGDLAVNYEGAFGRFYALDVRPEANYQAVVDLLHGYEIQEILTYETGGTIGE